MALEMKVYKEIAAYEPKPMFGRTWRQIAALAFMVGIGGGAFAGSPSSRPNGANDIRRSYGCGSPPGPNSCRSSNTTSRSAG